MPEVPEIYLSYSTKSPSEPVIALIDLLKKQIRKVGFEPRDPMQDIAIDDIPTKVNEALAASDAVFAEVTAPNPNVLYEIGYGRAMSYPIVCFVNVTRLQDLPEDWKVYFKLIQQSHLRPLPADLGALEYFRYSDDDLLVNSKYAHLSKRIDSLLGYVAKTYLCRGACFLRSNHKKFSEVAHRLTKEYDNDHPILAHLGGWYGQLAEESDREKLTAFEFNSRYYKGCLSAFGIYPSATVQAHMANAIADLTDTTEGDLWNVKNSPAGSTTVSERIFLVHWKVFFDPDNLERLTQLLNRERQQYSVRVGTVTDVDRAGSHPFKEKAVGRHLLVMDPDMVGGYVRRPDGLVYLRVERNAALYQSATEAYDERRAETIAFQSGWTSKDFRNAWMQHEEVGRWSPLWGPVASRDQSYFTKYDMHIRSWVPEYDALITDCLAHIQSEICDLGMRSRKLRVLELGFGTGALTIPLVDWIRSLNEPLKYVSSDPFVERFLGVDAAPQMKKILLGRMGSRGRDAWIHLYDGAAWHAFATPPVQNSGPFDIMCGSLVLHDIFGVVRAGADVKSEQFFQKCAAILNPNGRVIFADSFVAQDVGNGQIHEWRKWMIENGMTQDAVDAFLAENEEMIHTLEPSVLRAIAGKHGFEVQDVAYRRLRKGQRLSPFGTLVMRRRP